MPRAPVQQAQAPQAQTIQSVYESLWGACTTVNPKFPAPSDNESDQQFFGRIMTALGDENLPEAVWAGLSDAAQQWYDANFEAFSTDPENAELSPPEGWVSSEEEQQTNGEDVQAPVAAPAAAAPRGNTSGLERWRAEQRAKKEAAARGRPAPAAPPARRASAPAPVAAPAAAPVRRVAAPPAAPAPAAPVRRVAAPPAAQAPAAPARRVAAPAPAPVAAPARVAQQRGPNGESSMEMIRAFIVYNKANGNVDVTADDVMTYMAEQGFTVQRTTVGGTVSATKSVLDTMVRLGVWAPA